MASLLLLLFHTIHVLFIQIILLHQLGNCLQVHHQNHPYPFYHNQPPSGHHHPYNYYPPPNNYHHPGTGGNPYPGSNALPQHPHYNYNNNYPNEFAVNPIPAPPTAAATNETVHFVNNVTSQATPDASINPGYVNGYSSYPESFSSNIGYHVPHPPPFHPHSLPHSHPSVVQYPSYPSNSHLQGFHQNQPLPQPLPASSNNNLQVTPIDFSPTQHQQQQQQQHQQQYQPLPSGDQQTLASSQPTFYSGRLNVPSYSYPSPSLSYPYDYSAYPSPSFSGSSFPYPSGQHPSQSFHMPLTTTTTTTPKPKISTTKATTTTTTVTPKPFEFEISVEDLYYLSQIQSMLQNKTSIEGLPDLSKLPLASLSTARGKESGNKKNDEEPVFYGGVIDVEEFAKLQSLLGLKDLIKIEAQLRKEFNGKKPNFKDRDDEEKEDAGEEQSEDEEGNQRKRKKNQGQSSSSATEVIGSRNRKKDRKRRKPQRQDDDDNEGDENEGNEEVIEEEEEIEEDEDRKSSPSKVAIGSTPTKKQLNNRFKSSKKKKNSFSTTSTTTITPPIALFPGPYPFPYPYGYGYQPNLPQTYPSPPATQDLKASSSQASRQSSKNSNPPPSPPPQEEDKDSSSIPNENHNVINVNLLPDVLKGSSSSSSDGKHSLFFPFPQQDDTFFGTKYGSRRVSFGSMANGLVRKAVRSMVYRIFPSVKNVKGIAAKGCRDVQSIGSFDSIIMPLGLAVTLHPLLLPLVPFLLLALGSIKAIESATCFVSEYFK